MVTQTEDLVTIRPYTISDKADCLLMLDSNTPEYFADDDRNEFESFLDDLPGPYFIVEQEGKTIACGGWAAEKDDKASMTWGLVHRDYHDRGIGTALLKYRVTEAINSLECSVIQLKTIPRVVPFFEKTGFRTVEVKPDGFGPGYDEVTMQWRTTQPHPR